MKTRQLVAALAADRGRARSPAQSIAAAAVVGAIVAIALFAWRLGIRPDAAAAVERAAFLFKFVVTLSVAVPAVAALSLAVRPGREIRRALLAIGPVMLVIGVLVELATTSSTSWSARTIGSNSLLCLVTIPSLALAPFACLFYAARGGAPARPGVAGALCGLAASAIGATLYAAHCTDDSPLFVALWYSMAIMLATLVGSIVGARWLRW